MLFATPDLMLIDHLRNVDTIVAAGGHIPDAWQRIRSRYERVESFTADSAIARLTSVITTDIDEPDDLELGTLIQHARNAAMLGTPVGADVQGSYQNHVYAATHSALAAAYGTVAVENYDAMAKRYDKAADTFTKAWRLSHGNALDPAQIVAEPKAVQQAWLEVPALALEVDAALALLATAARLAGHEVKGNAEHLVTLAAETAWMRLVHVDAAWNTNARGGRWGAILDRKDTKLRAARLSKWEPFDDKPQLMKPVTFALSN
ncbi:hypothetical protein RN607_05465 [Demequina capsici]|uniref:Uncharacterized protein n=1 Tax=Demequina capsici TaxID=3075620 RepID=A0AA96FF22_9MICO|nr:hypothetical protein [Demequina sp. PMTSA13]WNM28450.1 hypothetical protein RN607_05465 [Demequina sp. PMTSA13]